MSPSEELKGPFDARPSLWDHVHRRWSWAARHAIYAKWLGWKYRALVCWKRHRNTDGERVPGVIVSIGVAYAEWF